LGYALSGFPSFLLFLSLSRCASRPVGLSPLRFALVEFCVQKKNRNYFLLSDIDTRSLPMSAPASSTSAPASSASSASGGSAAVLPSPTILLQATKLAMEQDRAILLDYYEQTANGTAFLGEDPETKERILVKSKEEFTSLIKKLYKVGDDFIILTENSIYIVSGKIQKRKVNLAALQEAYDAL
jgi:hypothetical protein